MSMRRVAGFLAPFVIALPLALVLVEGALRAGLLGSGPNLPMIRIANKKADGKGNIRPGSLVLLCYPSNYRGYFKIDLANPATLAYYESVGMRNLDKALPKRRFAVEQPFNSQVYLGPEFKAKREGITRVVIMGDSFNMGWGLRLEDRVSDRLEALLNKGGERYEVLNAGIPSGDFPELYYKYRDLLPLKPDILILGMTLNDTLRSPELANPPLETSPLVMTRRVEDSSGLGFFDLRIGAMLRKFEKDRADTRIMIDWYKALGSDRNSTGIVATRQYIREMDQTLKHRGGRFILALWPLLVPWDEGYPFHEIHERTAGFAKDRGIEFADLLPPLLTRKAPDLWVHPVDRHPNEVASALAAERLARAILEN
jgi:lysophospholipase L1-like esterase